MYDTVQTSEQIVYDSPNFGTGWYMTQSRDPEQVMYDTIRTSGTGCVWHGPDFQNRRFQLSDQLLYGTVPTFITVVV